MVTRDHEAEKIAEFDSVYTKLMGDPDDMQLEERYIGKQKRLASQPSLTTLERIKARYHEPNDHRKKSLIRDNSVSSSVDDGTQIMSSVPSRSLLRVASDPSYQEIKQDYISTNELQYQAQQHHSQSLVGKNFLVGSSPIISRDISQKHFSAVQSSDLTMINEFQNNLQKSEEDEENSKKSARYQKKLAKQSYRKKAQRPSPLKVGLNMTDSEYR